MTVLEQRFMESAIAYFNRKHNDNPFIEVTAVLITSGKTKKIMINRNNLAEVEPCPGEPNETAKCYLHFADMGCISVTETYDEIKAML